MVLSVNPTAPTVRTFLTDDEALHRGFPVRIRRDETAKERADEQLTLYKPCPCGSGKRFKFCCNEKKEER